MNAYAADVLETEQRSQSEDLAPVYTTDADREKGRRLLREGLQLLRQKTAELARSRESHDTVQGDSGRSRDREHA